MRFSGSSSHVWGTTHLRGRFNRSDAAACAVPVRFLECGEVLLASLVRDFVSVSGDASEMGTEELFGTASAETARDPFSPRTFREVHVFSTTCGAGDGTIAMLAFVVPATACDLRVDTFFWTLARLREGFGAHDLCDLLRCVIVPLPDSSLGRGLANCSNRI